MIPRDPTFAPAINDLRRTPLADLVVTPEPSPGQGYPLDEEGHAPLTIISGTYTLNFVTISFDGGATGPGGTSLYSAAAPTGTCNVGDFCFSEGPVAAQGLIWFGGGPITAVDTLPIRAYNPTGGSINPTATDITWVVFKALRTTA